VRLTRADWVRLLLLWLGGIDLRLTMLAIPPLVPIIHRELHLDEKSVGVLVSGPVLILAVAAVPGSLLIARLGIRRALSVGLGFVALFGALRGVGPSATVLFGATFLMGVGVAVTQPAFPAIVREWFPRRIAIATAAYSNGLLIGETIPTAFTTPFGALPVAHGDWRWALALWSLVVLVTGIAIVGAAPRAASGAVARPGWWPDWRANQTAQLGLVMGMASAVYFGANAFIPDFLDQTGRHNLISATLGVLNGAQLLTAPTVVVWPRLLSGRFGFVASAALMGVAQLGVQFAPGAAVVACAGFLGYSTALAFIAVLTYPPRLAPPGDVARMSAAIFTLQYATAFVVPLLAGALWDATGRAVVAFVPGIGAALLMAWGALSLRLPGQSFEL
jgi:CP family cyanate transporter-like MFS transporter